MKKASKYSAKQRNINTEKRRVLALLDTHIRAVDWNGLQGEKNPTTEIIRQALSFIRAEIVRDAHRGKL